MKLSPIRYGLIICAFIAAVLHIRFFPDIMFTLNGLGYLGLLGAYLLPIAFFQQKHALVWWGFVGYTALTILLWGIMGDKHFVAGTDSAIGYYASGIEAVLLALLWSDKPKS